MKVLFDVDGPLYKFMTTLTNMFLITLCWFLGSIPIVTVGASTIAACDMGLKMVKEEEGYIFKEFWKSYKSNLKQGVIMGIITVVAYYSIYLDFELVKNMKDPSILMIIFGYLAFAFITACTIYTFPLLARYENTIPKTMKNSFHIFTKFFIRSVALCLCLIAENVAFNWNLTMWFLQFILGPSGYILTICIFARPIFDKLEEQQKNGEV